MRDGLNLHDTVKSEREAVKTYLARNEELMQIRLQENDERRQICEYIFPRRNFELRTDSQKGAYRKRLVDTTAKQAHERLSATLFGYLYSPHAPFIRPYALERDFSYDEDAWADECARRMHRYLMSSTSNFRQNMAEDLDDATAFGDSIMWQQKRPRGSLWMSVPNHQMCWAENENGVIDEHHRRFRMSLRRALLRWPDSVKLKDMAAKTERPEAAEVEILHVVEPRPGGVKGDLREIKPWKDLLILIDGMEMLDTGGHDRKPLNVGRFKRRPGEAYGEGVGWTMLPLQKFASAIMASYSEAAELAARPPLGTFLPQGTMIDRRPSAVNRFNTLMSGQTRDPTKLIFEIQKAGDIRMAADLLRIVWARIEQAAYVDWLTPNEGPQMTATEVLDRRDLRLRSLGPLVARIENEKMAALAENTFEDMMDAGMLPRPPASLDQVWIGFEFLGPLTLAQRQGEGEGVQRMIALAKQLGEVTGDPAVGRMLKGDDIMRNAANSWGVDSKWLSSPDEMAAFREGQRELGEMQEEMAAAESAARALQASGQGISNLAQITQAA